MTIFVVIFAILLFVVLSSVTESIASTTEEITGTMGQFGYIDVTEEGNAIPIIGSLFSELDKDVIDRIDRIPGVKGAAPRISGMGQLKDVEISINGRSTGREGNSPVMFTGIDPQKEELMDSYPTKMIKGSIFSSERKSRFAIIGKELADNADLDVGDEITLMYDKDGDGIIDSKDEHDFEIRGIYKFGSIIDDNQLVLSLDDARDVKGMKRTDVSSIRVQAEPGMSDRVVKLMKAKLPDVTVISMEELTEEFEESTAQIEIFIFIIKAIAILIGFVFILIMMMRSVSERTKEIGTLRAIGWHKIDVLKLITFESLVISIIGTVIGVTLGILAPHILQVVLQLVLPMLFPGMTAAPLIADIIHVTPAIIMDAFIIGAFSGIAGGILPAWRAANMNPVEAFRAE